MRIEVKESEESEEEGELGLMRWTRDIEEQKGCNDTNAQKTPHVQRCEIQQPFSF